MFSCGKSRGLPKEKAGCNPLYGWDEGVGDCGSELLPEIIYPVRQTVSGGRLSQHTFSSGLTEQDQLKY